MPTTQSKWLDIGATLMVGLFVAYIDRTNLSVGIQAVAKDLGFAGDAFAVTASWALTIFLVGYAFANVLGGFLTSRLDPKVVVTVMFAIWSIATLIAGFTNSLVVLLACRCILGVAEGIYWPQQSRFVHAWFAEGERTKANALIQYYGQYLALALGYMILLPIFNAFGWRVLFYITGGIGLVAIVPLYLAKLRPATEAPHQPDRNAAPKSVYSLAAFGGPAFFFLLITYFTQAMMFWGITLWIPLTTKSLGFEGFSQALATAAPYVAAVLFAIPIARISDRTGKRILIATLGLLIPGVMMMALPFVDSAIAKLALITVGLGYYAASFTPNIWTILQANVAPEAVGPASGVMNGLGAGGGGTIAGFLVGMLKARTGDYTVGFIVLGALVFVGGLSLIVYGRLTSGKAKQEAASWTRTTNAVSGR